MSLIRFRPARDVMGLHSAMQRLLDDAFVGGGWSGEGEGVVTGFPVDLYDKQDALELHAVLPGVKPDDIDISVTGNTVSIRAECRAEQDVDRGGALLRERTFGTMQRAFTVPTQISADKVEASFENGVLKVRLPKSDAVRPKKISVTGGSKAKAIDTGDGRESKETKETREPAAGSRT